MLCGVLLVVASAVMIVAALRGGPPRVPRPVVARATSTPTVAPRGSASPRPTAAPTPRPTALPSVAPTAAPAPRASYTPLRPVEVRVFPATPAPAATPAPRQAPSPAPTATPSPAPRPPSPPPPRPARTSEAGPLVGGPEGDACLQTLTYLKTAADDRLTRREIYNAALAGLAMNAHCAEPRRSVNEAYLLAMRAPAEFSLHIGDWNADLSRSDTLLDACAASPEFRATTVAADCATQRKFNDLVRRRILQISGRRPSPAAR